MEMKELLATKDRRLEALEADAIEQKSVIAALQQSVSGTQVAAANRQGTSTVPRSCADLKCKGETISGLYSIMGAKSVEMVYCDFSKATNDAGKPVYAHSEIAFLICQPDGTNRIPKVAGIR
jgi:hypothetical protein